MVDDTIIEWWLNNNLDEIDIDVNTVTGDYVLPTGVSVFRDIFANCHNTELITIPPLEYRYTKYLHTRVPHTNRIIESVSTIDGIGITFGYDTIGNITLAGHSDGEVEHYVYVHTGDEFKVIRSTGVIEFERDPDEEDESSDYTHIDAEEVIFTIPKRRI